MASKILKKSTYRRGTEIVNKNHVKTLVDHSTKMEIKDVTEYENGMLKTTIHLYTKGEVIKF